VPDDHKLPLYDNPGEDVILLVKEDRKNRKNKAEKKHLNEAPVDRAGKIAAQKQQR
jgi:hypothetical protein